MTISDHHFTTSLSEGVRNITINMPVGPMSSRMHISKAIAKLQKISAHHISPIYTGIRYVIPVCGCVMLYNDLPIHSVK